MSTISQEQSRQEHFSFYPDESYSGKDHEKQNFDAIEDIMAHFYR